MPPKAKITKEMIINAGLEVVRREGYESLNVRKIAAELNCSTQPIMYHYTAVDDLKSDIYAAADALHTEYIMRVDGDNGDNPMLSIGLNYIRFANEEKHLFQFLFQSDKFTSSGFGELMASEALNPIIQPLSMATGLPEPQAREIFETLFICVHGCASLLANNSMEYNESHCKGLLEATYNGIIGYKIGGNYEETV